MSVQQEGDGEKIGLVAQIFVSDDELEEFLDKPKVIGCVWEEFRAASYHDNLLREAYPKLNAGSYHVVVLGEDIPTLAQTRSGRTIGVSFIAFGVACLSLIIWMWRRARRREQNQKRFAKDDAVRRISSGAPGGEHDQSFWQFDQPSEFATSIRTWAMLVSKPALIIGGGFYLLQVTELVSGAVGMWGMAISVLIGIVSDSCYRWSYRFFAEQVYETRTPEALPKAARNYFEQETPNLEAMGFVYLGDVMVIDKIRVFERLFLSADGACLATLESAGRLMMYNFLSIAADGTLLHTVSLDLQRPANTSLPSRCQWSQTKEIANAFRQHHELVVNYLAETDEPDGCLAIDPEYVVGVMDYAHRIAGWSQIESGGVMKRVPPLPQAEQLTKHEQGQRKFGWQARPNHVAFTHEAINALHSAQSEYAEVATRMFPEREFSRTPWPLVAQDNILTTEALWSIRQSNQEMEMVDALAKDKA